MLHNIRVFKALAGLFVLLLFICCSNKIEPPPKNIKEQFKKLIPLSALESAGFEHIAPSKFDLLFGKGFLYILSMNEQMIAKFVGNQPCGIYKAQKGQGPQELLAPNSIFFYGSDSIAIHDSRRMSIIIFDLDLNYIKEIKITGNFSEIASAGTRLMAFMYNQNHVFAFLDDHFNITGTFVQSNNELPFEGYFRRWLNQGYFVDNRHVAHSYWRQPRKNCCVDIYDIDKKKLVLSLSWEQPFSPSQKDIDAMREIYFSTFVYKAGAFYVVQNSFKKEFADPPGYDLSLFNESGELILSRDFPYQILRFKKDIDDTVIYVMDDDEDIAYVDVRNILPGNL